MAEGRHTHKVNVYFKHTSVHSPSHNSQPQPLLPEGTSYYCSNVLLAENWAQ